MVDQDRPARPTRVFVAAFLGFLLFCGVARIEAWPFSAFRLFSVVRHETQIGWRYEVVDAAGAHPMPWRTLGPAYQGWVQMAARFPRLSEQRRLEVCRAYLTGARTVFPHADAIRILRVERTLSQRVGQRSVPGSSTLAYECRDDGVTIA